MLKTGLEHDKRAMPLIPLAPRGSPVAGLFFAGSAEVYREGLGSGSGSRSGSNERRTRSTISELRLRSSFAACSFRRAYRSSENLTCVAAMAVFSKKIGPPDLSVREPISRLGFIG